MSLYPLIMAGGLGTRLWPLTTGGVPKAFLSFDNTGISLLRRTILRLSRLTALENIFIVALQSHEKELCMQAQDISASNIILEPVGRSTLPCIGLAGLYIKRYGPSSIMIVLPGEQLIKDEVEFQQIVIHAVETAQKHNSIVTLGIKPTFPATRFGYIRIGEEISCINNIRVFKSLGFTEKPDDKKALEFLSSGEYFWNSGMFVFSTSLLFEMISELAPDVYENLMIIDKAIGAPDERETIEQVYPNMRSISIDYAVMEKSDNTLVIPADMGWNDMGTWPEVAEIWEADENSNTCVGNHVGIDTSGCIIYNTDKLVATIGIHNIIVVNTPNGLLLCAKERADDVKMLVQKILNAKL